MYLTTLCFFTFSREHFFCCHLSSTPWPRHPPSHPSHRSFPLSVLQPAFDIPPRQAPQPGLNRRPSPSIITSSSRLHSAAGALGHPRCISTQFDDGTPAPRGRGQETERPPGSFSPSSQLANQSLRVCGTQVMMPCEV